MKPSNVLLVTLLIACGGDGRTPSDPPPAPALRIVVNAGASQLAIGRSTQVSASVTTSTGAAANVVVQWSSSDASVLAVTASSAATATVTALKLGSATITGTVDGASASTLLAVVNPAPVLTAVSPDRIPAGSPALTLTLRGEDFVSDSKVQWNGAERPTTFVSAQQLRASIPSADLAQTGTARVTVVSPAPGGGASAAVSVFVEAPATGAPVPVLSELSPRTAVAGGTTTTVRVLGSGFVDRSTVQWNGVRVPTTFVSATELRAQVPAGELTGAGDVEVAVSTAAPGGGTSAHQTFTLTWPNGMPVTGLAVPSMSSFDDLAARLLTQYSMPGGAIAVVKDGRLVYAHGFGYADVDARERVQPDALFRIASVSKPIVAVGMLKLIEQGRLRLTDRAFSFLNDLTQPPGTTRDARLNDITIAQLLQHSGGWDRDATFDPVFQTVSIANSMGVTPPASAETIVRYMLGQPLQFAPGSRYGYSNFGYTVLARIAERVSGQTFTDFLTTTVLRPAGMTRTRMGRTRLSERAPGEVRYYAVAGQPLNYPMVTSVFPGEGQVPQAYGGFFMDVHDGNGGWISSTVDLLRFVTAVDGSPTRPDILSIGSIQSMIARPAVSTWASSAYWYGLGWLVRPSGGDANWWHDGSLPGTQTLLVRAYNGLAWVALFNARAANSGAFAGALDNGLWQAVGAVTNWPSHDLFSRY